MQQKPKSQKPKPQKPKSQQNITKCQICKKRNANIYALMDCNEPWMVCEYCNSNIIENTIFESGLEQIQIQ